MKRYYTIKNPFYPSFKTLRQAYVMLKKEEQRNAEARRTIALGLLIIASLINPK